MILIKLLTDNVRFIEKQRLEEEFKKELSFIVYQYSRKNLSRVPHNFNTDISEWGMNCESDDSFSDFMEGYQTNKQTNTHKGANGRLFPFILLSIYQILNARLSRLKVLIHWDGRNNSKTRSNQRMAMKKRNIVEEQPNVGHQPLISWIISPSVICSLFQCLPISFPLFNH
jgi:hypothetical protein